MYFIFLSDIYGIIIFYSLQIIMSFTIHNTPNHIEQSFLFANSNSSNSFSSSVNRPEVLLQILNVDATKGFLSLFKSGN